MRKSSTNVLQAESFFVMLIQQITVFLCIGLALTINLRNIVPKNRFIGDYACRPIIKPGLNPQSPFLLLRQLPLLDCILACRRHPNCLSASYVTEYIHKGSYCLLARHTVTRDSALHEVLGAVYFEFRCPTGEKLPIPQKIISHGRIPSMCGKPMDFGSNLHLYRYKRVEGGRETQPYSQPWLGQVVKGYQNICGSTLIAGRTMSQGSTVWALTAAHCFKSDTDVSTLRVNVRDYKVMFGAYDLRYPTPHTVVRKALSITIHHDYDYFNNDIAVIKFDRKLFFNDYIRPACLPSPDTLLDLLNQCVTCGYGVTYDNKRPDRPSCISRNFVFDRRTKEVSFRMDPERASMNYSYNTFESGASPGDSGGPFVCTYAGWHNVLMGVVASRMKSLVYVDDRLAKVTMYAHVPHYIPWILGIVNAPDEILTTKTPKLNTHNIRACWGSFAKSCSESRLMKSP